MPVITENSELILYGAVGDVFWEESFTAREVVASLASMRGKDISVRLNSGGGIADEGVAIYNSLKAHKGRVTVYIDGIAASAASIIAMAGEKVVMRTGSVMMVHDPMMLSIGNADDMEKAIQALNAIGDSMADIYAAKTGRKATAIRAEMKDELWLTPSEAKAKGFADSENDEDAIEASAFDYRAYSKAPERIYALSDAKAWSNRLKARKALAASNEERKPPMADTVTKEAAAAEAEAKAKAATTAEQDRAAGIIEACAKAGVPALAASLIRSGSSLDEARAKAAAENDRVTAIRKKVDAARASCKQIDASMADRFIVAGTSVEQAGTELFDLIVATKSAAPETRAHHDGNGDDGGRRARVPSATAIYAKRREARGKAALTE